MGISAKYVTYLHGCAYCKWQLTEWGLQDVDQRHGDENLLRVQDVPVIQRHVDAKHGEGNLGVKTVNVTFVWRMISKETI